MSEENVEIVRRAWEAWEVQNPRWPAIRVELFETETEALEAVGP